MYVHTTSPLCTRFQSLGGQATCLADWQSWRLSASNWMRWEMWGTVLHCLRTVSLCGASLTDLCRHSCVTAWSWFWLWSVLTVVWQRGAGSDCDLCWQLCDSVELVLTVICVDTVVWQRGASLTVICVDTVVWQRGAGSDCDQCWQLCDSVELVWLWSVSTQLCDSVELVWLWSLLTQLCDSVELVWS